MTLDVRDYVITTGFCCCYQIETFSPRDGLKSTCEYSLGMQPARRCAFTKLSFKMMQARHDAKHLSEVKRAARKLVEKMKAPRRFLFPFVFCWSTLFWDVIYYQNASSDRYMVCRNVNENILTKRVQSVHTFSDTLNKIETIATLAAFLLFPILRVTHVKQLSNTEPERRESFVNARRAIGK